MHAPCRERLSTERIKTYSVSKCAAQLRKAFPSTTRINKNDTGSFSSYSCKGRPISQKCGQIPVSFPFLRSIVFACSCIAVLLIYFLYFYRKSSYLKRLHPNFGTESLWQIIWIHFSFAFRIHSWIESPLNCLHHQMKWLLWIYATSSKKI